MERRLAAILLTDIVGYSRLIGLDEEGTIARQRVHREQIIDLKISKHRGRIVKTTGDGLLVEFPSVVDAVKCAIEVQTELADRDTDVPKNRSIQYRIGINLGDFVVDGDDILGDGVNVAARLEGLAKPGGVCISGTVHDHLSGKVSAVFEEAGEQEVKNIPRPVRVWHWQPGRAAGDPPKPDKLLPLPDKPSIAVLPFDNMSGEPEQEFFADGIAEDVITALSRFRSLFVIARNSSFTYKGSVIDIAQVARELGVRYVVEGSVRKAGIRVRITTQLIDATSGRHLWADRFDGSLDDVFELQDQITEQIVVSVEPEIGAHERALARRKPPESLDAWELFQCGLSHFYHMNQGDHAEAIRLFQEAIARDSEFAAAHAYLSYPVLGSVLLGYTNDVTTALATARASAERAVSLDPNEPMAHFSLGRVLLFGGEAEMAIGEMQSAISINPNFAWGHYGLGLSYYYGLGQADEAIPPLSAASRLNPRGPLRWMPLIIKGSALRNLGRHDEAIATCRQACQVPDAGYLPYMHLAAALGAAGRTSEAQDAVEKATHLQPAFSIGFLRNQFMHHCKTTLNSLLDSLRKAGVPD